MHATIIMEGRLVTDPEIKSGKNGDYSAQQFDAESIQHLNVDDAFLQEAVDGDYCFVEDAALTPFERWIEKIIIFRWHRTYPADQHFDIDLSGGNWKICESVEFTGHSHERITIEVYLR